MIFTGLEMKILDENDEECPPFVPSYLQVVDEIPKTASEKPIERFAPDAEGVYACT